MLKKRWCIVLICAAAANAAALAQQKSEKATAPLAQESPPLVRCDRDRALDLVNDQLDELKMFANSPKRIALMVKAAELLWALEEERARAILKSSYELASDYVVQKAKAPPDMNVVFNGDEDPRITVVKAVARKDAAWAKLLSERMTEEMKEAERLKSATDAEQSQTGESLLSVAHSVIDTDGNLALALARRSLQHRPTYSLVSFLYGLAKADPAAANQFYREAVQASAGEQIKALLWLSSYPFGQPRLVGPDRSSFSRHVDEGFQPSSAEQQLFLETILNRAAAFGAAPPPPSSDNQYVSEAASLHLAMQQLVTLAAQYQPAYVPRIAASKLALSAHLTEKDRGQTAELSQRLDEMDNDTSESILDRAEKEVDVDKRDMLISNAVTAKGSTENPERIESLIRKVSDSELRKQLSSWFFFTRAQKAIEKKQLDEATQYLEGVDELDLRAYLAMEIATKRIEKAAQRQRATDVLEPVISLALKASDSAAKAKALFGLTYLYAKLDRARAFSVMNEAIKTVNNSEAKDLASGNFVRAIKGKAFMSFSMYQIPGFTPENTFLGLENQDFDAVLSMALNLSDKSLRSSVMLALAEQCLAKHLAEEKKKQDAMKKITKKPQAKPAPQSN
ncbi:MAG: hypothetical protein WKF30_09535 [Pyrinomonadaceae bacterium]